jgi:sigma-B regulation protein RsbU (phosphoserine phosphatase)
VRLSRLLRAGNGEPAEGAEQLRRIQAVSEAALAHLDLDDLLIALLERVCETLEVDTAAILLLDRDSQELVATAALGIEEEVRNGVRIPLGKGFARRIADEGHAVILEQA